MMFCSTKHKNAFHDRWKIRGRQLAPLEVAARITRGGSRGDKATGIAARQDAERLKQRWIEEDRTAKPPRMSMVTYLARRRALGFEI